MKVGNCQALNLKPILLTRMGFFCLKFCCTMTPGIEIYVGRTSVRNSYTLPKS
ncbi:hypothetical protein BMETH_19_1 [methanotrophic bacterial endosymbiont of Bathymodiolus sp.]|nr:hypothetical protein BMETH_19_1 [methanotrophic bacterial endosymbiont of Bathymodiolus sp.]